MERSVLVAISGARFTGDDKNDVELITVGSYFCRNGKHYVVYDEISDDGKDVVKSVVRMTPDCLDIIRSGGMNSHMIFEKGQKNVCCYMTPYGEMMVGVQTRAIHMEESEDLLRTNVEYSLDINYEHMADCNITITVQPRGGTEKQEEGSRQET